MSAAISAPLGHVGDGRIGRIGRIGDRPVIPVTAIQAISAVGRSTVMDIGSSVVVAGSSSTRLLATSPDVEPVSVASPGPCTCLTKTYTQDGLVVFADVCTKEAASAPVGGASSDATPVPPANGKSSDAAPVTPAADATQAPTTPNFAGLTYQDFLKANGQAAAQTQQQELKTPATGPRRK